jgi:molybdenum cofactor cytidylyltransferase
LIAAILLAAGRSARMGRPKMVLPVEGGLPLIRHVAQAFLEAGVEHVIAVTGADRELVEAALAGTPARLAFNPDHVRGEMLSSIKVGLEAAQRAGAEAAFLHPADVAFVSPDTIRALIRSREEGRRVLVAPSHQGRRGHPIMIGQELWPEVLKLPAGQTLRDFLRRHADDTRYVVVDDQGVLRDVDTPEDYRGIQMGP